MLTRAAALLILAAVTPIAAAGLVSEAGRSWFWKSLRWFHAAALTPVLCVLVMGLGIKLTTGVAQGATASAEAAIGTAFPGVMLILVSVVAPVALFKLLAFVDPGTSSGASMRAGMASAGGVQGLLGGSNGGGGGAQQGGTTSTASAGSGSSGQSQGEAQSNAATASRFGSALGAVGGGAGSVFAAGVGVAAHAGAVGAAVGVDEMNQTGVGDSSYYPDNQRSAQRFNPDVRDPGQTGEGGGEPAGTSPAGGGPGIGQASQTNINGPTAGGSSAAAAVEVPPVAQIP